MSSENSKPITKQEIIELMKNRGMTVEKVIDAIIEANGFIGVGLITLGETIDKHITKHIKKGASPSFD
jgi:hypothetical protein